MKYLVTGASGFIGSHLVECILTQGHKVVGIDNFDDYYDYKIKIKNTIDSLSEIYSVAISGNKDKDIELLAHTTASENYKLYPIDIRNLEALEVVFSAHRFDVVIHLAALAGVRPSLEKPLEYESVNIRGSLNLWEMCKKHQIKKFICASSSSVYGNNEKIPFSEEDFVDHPISPYAATKKATEVLGHVYHHLYGIDMMQLRFFTVYGPRQRPDLAIHKLTRLLYQNKPIPFYGDGNTCRDYTYIEDIIDGISKSIKYIESNTNVYEIINLGENEVVTLQEMISALEKETRKKAILDKQPMPPGDVNKTNANINKAKSMIGYSPKTDFRSGIAKFISWYNENQSYE